MHTAKEVIASDFEEAGDEDVFRKLRGDFDAAGVAQSDDEIRGKMLDLMDQAVSEKMVQDTKVAVVYHSGYGHTKVQAEQVLAGALSVENTDAILFEAAEAIEKIDKLDEVDAIIFGSPTYMGTVSAPFKAFMDASSTKWMEQAWKNKIAGGFTNSASASGDKTGTLQTMSVLAAQHGMIWVGLDLPPGNNTTNGTDDAMNRMGASMGAMAQSLADTGPDVSPPKSDQQTAHYYGARIAEAAQRWGKTT
ncbi:Flavodoxin FldP [Nymphon striatum]|nr:Flavodoxin FldP [Nymphon striatum]